jgi:hypothetical protein
MPTLNLNILVVPTYDTFTLGIADASTYPDSPPVVTSPLIEITIPSFDTVSFTFPILETTFYNSETLLITPSGDNLVSLPDGIYTLKYSIDPADINYIERSIMRVDRLQEKFDTAFMKLDMMECDREIKTQSKVDLNSIYFFIQGAIAAANNCATEEANKLYHYADKMLDRFLGDNCGCSGNNYKKNF